MIKFNDVTFNYGDGTAIGAINLHIPARKICFVLGENGSGKTTLLKLMLGLLAPTAGDILVDGDAIAKLTARQRAKRMAYIPQDHAPIFNLAVEDIILMGCANQLHFFSKPAAADRQRARQIAAQIGIAHLLDKGYKQISGGERQLCLIARALMQSAQLIAMDEPTANLDFAHQQAFFERCQALTDAGHSIVITSHQPADALDYADYVLFMKNRQCIAQGAVSDLMTARRLSELYGIDISKTKLLKARSN